MITETVNLSAKDSSMSSIDSIHLEDIDNSKIFDSLMRDLQLDNQPAGGAFVIYKNGKCIVSSCVGQANTATDWTENTLSLNFSTGKGILATLIHILASQNLLDYDQPIADYWSEFACHGKELITLRQVMSHQSELFAVDSIISHPEEMQDWQAMVSHVANIQPKKTSHSPTFSSNYWSSETSLSKNPQSATEYSSTYNALVYGWILGAIIEKVTSLSLQEALDFYLAKPLGIVGELYFELPKNKLEKVAVLARFFTDNKQIDTKSESHTKYRKPILKADSKKTLQTYQSLSTFNMWQNVWQQKNSEQTTPLELTTAQINSLYFDAKLLHLPSYKSSLMPNNKQTVNYYDSGYLQAIIPALNCIASATALAKVYAMLANKGTFEGQELLTPHIFEQMTEIQTTGMDTVMPASISHTNNEINNNSNITPSITKTKNIANSMLWRLGYHRVFSLTHSVHNAFGHCGYNGSMAWCDVDKNIAAVYVHNYETTMLTDIRQFALTETTLNMIDNAISQ